VNFTREPVIETILSPKEGYKLCIKNSKINDAEELLVDAVEVVSFGHASFFRGQERPKPFLVPVSDYEIFEVKEARVALKNAQHERNIKIGGGREAFVKPVKEQVVTEEGQQEAEMQGIPSDSGKEGGKNDKRRDRRRNRRKRMGEERKDQADLAQNEEDVEEMPLSNQEGSIEEEQEKPSPSLFTHLLPPPPLLISENLAKIRAKEKELQESPLVEELPSREEVNTSQEEELPF